MKCRACGGPIVLTTVGRRRKVWVHANWKDWTYNEHRAVPMRQGATDETPSRPIR